MQQHFVSRGSNYTYLMLIFFISFAEQSSEQKLFEVPAW